MAVSLFTIPLYEKQQKGEDTDCIFVFKCESEEGAVEKVIRAHKFILSLASSVFETKFKEEWKGNQPIQDTSLEYSTFENLIRSIYLGEIKFENLEQAFDLYEAIHFYQVDSLLNLLRDEIQKHYYSKNVMQISQLCLIAAKYDDYRLKSFSKKYFMLNAYKIFKNDDFLNLKPNFINSLFLLNQISASEQNLLNALEKYVETNGNDKIKCLRPAIESIRFLSLPSERMNNSILLNQDEKAMIEGKPAKCLTHFSKSKVGRDVIPFISLFSAKTQNELTTKIIGTPGQKCWVCSTDGHSLYNCSEAHKKYNCYQSLYSKNLIPYFDSQYLMKCSKEDIITILQEFQKQSVCSPDFTHFSYAQDEINNIMYA
uniref:CSON014050 protein n=1 Tax=Culicoides sonorensis TaxID=179676 RepID=A0A336KT88_CULSO